jgi:hypothetical protein
MFTYYIQLWFDGHDLTNNPLRPIGADPGLAAVYNRLAPTYSTGCLDVDSKRISLFAEDAASCLYRTAINF